MEKKKIITLGIDVGNAMINTSTGFCCQARVTNDVMHMNKEDIKIKYDESEFTIGENNGALNISKNKYKKLHYKLCLLTAIAESVNEDTINCNVVVGCPVEDFNNKEHIASIKETVKDLKNEVIYINDVRKTINIKDADVFCESGVVFVDRKRFMSEKTLVIDFGGSTVDISYWEGLRLAQARTYKEGCFTLYEDIIKIINKKFNTNLPSYEARHMIGKDKYEIEQQEQDIRFINTTVQNYVDGLISYINQYFPTHNANSIQLIGGGAVMLQKLIKEEYTKAELFNSPEFANANTYASVGELIWK